ncbi:MAG: hypothetical protein IPI58_03665 [Alphaproteobacteria bacterium]|nr:MAG: hypothetical protein IPI58_03665 [Alphaproteobacteria bacterium]
MDIPDGHESGDIHKKWLRAANDIWDKHPGEQWRKFAEWPLTVRIALAGAAMSSWATPLRQADLPYDPDMGWPIAQLPSQESRRHVVTMLERARDANRALGMDPRYLHTQEHVVRTFITDLERSPVVNILKSSWPRLHDTTSDSCDIIPAIISVFRTLNVGGMLPDHNYITCIPYHDHDTPKISDHWWHPSHRALSEKAMTTFDNQGLGIKNLQEHLQIILTLYWQSWRKALPHVFGSIPVPQLLLQNQNTKTSSAGTRQYRAPPEMEQQRQESKVMAERPEIALADIQASVVLCARAPVMTRLAGAIHVMIHNAEHVVQDFLGGAWKRNLLQDKCHQQWIGAASRFAMPDIHRRHGYDDRLVFDISGLSYPETHSFLRLSAQIHQGSARIMGARFAASMAETLFCENHQYPLGTTSPILPPNFSAIRINTDNVPHTADCTRPKLLPKSTEYALYV